MTARIDKSPLEYLQPAPRREQTIRIGFTPNHELDRAVRGFLIPEARPDMPMASKIGATTLHSLHAKIFHYDRSDNDGIRYDPVENELLAEERKRLAQLQSDHLPVVGMHMRHTNKNPNTLLIFELGLTDRQRRLLGGLVLQEALGSEHSVLPVGIVLRRSQLAAPEAIVQHREELAEDFLEARHVWNEHRMASSSLAYYATRPHLSEDRQLRG